MKRWIIRMFRKWVENDSIAHCAELDICENCPWHRADARTCNAVAIKQRLSEVERRYARTK